MATENYQEHSILNFLSDAAITKDLGVKLAAGREVAKCSVAGERSIGVARDTVTEAADDIGVVPGFAFKLITSGAAFADLAELAMDADGKYRTATAGQVVVAIAMAAAGGADEQVLALILPMGQYRVPSASIVDITDNTGLSGTHDDTLAATAVPADIAGGDSPTEAEHNALLAVIRVMAQNASDLAQKVKELVAVLDAHSITL